MNKRKNENFISYAKRITKARGNNELTYKQWGDLLLGSDNPYSSENLRKAWRILDLTLDRINDNVEITQEDVLKDIEKEKDELFKERVRLQDKKREYNKCLREDARFERLLEVMKESVEPFEMIKNASNMNKIEKEASLLLSDLHMGLKVDNQVNFFSVEVAKERLQSLFNKTENYCTINNVTKINVELLGDLISGIIQVTARCEQEEDIMTQIMTCSDVLSNLINELAKKFEVVVYGVIGNHSRVMADKKQNLTRENFERLIFEYIKLKCPSVKVLDSKCADYMTYKVNDKTIVLSHGDKDTLANAKNHFISILGFIPDYIHLGHVHNFNIKDDCNTNIVVNGSLISTDDYALSIRKHTKASQTLIIYDEDICIYKIELE